MNKIDSVDNLIALAKTVASNAKKIDFYEESSKEAPQTAVDALESAEKELDSMVMRLLKKEPNLKEAIIYRQDVNDDHLKEIEWSYQKAVCFKELPDGRHSRLFFLPFIYWVDENKKTTGVIEFTQRKTEAFQGFMASFLETHHPSDMYEELDDDDNDIAMASPEVKMFHKNLLHCLILEEEEKSIPLLHQALLDGVNFDETSAFSRREVLGSSDSNAGWTVGALPFVIIHESEEYLHEINFEQFNEEFVEEFEEIFDPSSQSNYDIPVPPNVIAEAGSRHLWQKQVFLTLEDMIRTKKAKHLGVIEITMVMADEQLAGVVMNFEMGDPSVAPDQPQSLVYHRQISRNALLGEEPFKLAGFMMSIPALRRKDFKIVFNYDHVKN